MQQYQQQSLQVRVGAWSIEIALKSTLQITEDSADSTLSITSTTLYLSVTVQILHCTWFLKSRIQMIQLNGLKMMIGLLVLLVSVE